MRRLGREEFFQKAAESDIGLDQKYSNPQTLVFQSSTVTWKRWTCPSEPGRALLLLDCLLNATGPWETCWIYKRAGFWNVDLAEDMDLPGKVLALHLAWLGVPVDCEDVIEATAQETAHIISICYSFLLFGGSVWEDVTIMPQGAEAIFEVTHHREIIVTARTPQKLRSIQKALRLKGFRPF